MAEAERVVEAIQTDAAAEVAAVAVAGDSVIAAEVAAVGDELADHAELSEERHEEILGEQSWVGQRVESVAQGLQNLSTSTAAVQAQLSTSLQVILSSLSALQTTVENRLPSPVSMPLTPEPSSETVIAVVEPESAGEGSLAEKTELPRKRKRRII